jgi:hypothetical protein
MAPIEEDSIAGGETATMLLVEQGRILVHLRQEHMHALRARMASLRRTAKLVSSGSVRSQIR